jgi:hypothetical protein
MDKNVYDILKNKSEQYGIPFNVIYSVVMTESGGNPLAVGDSGKSFGLFQVNTAVHKTYNIEKGKSDISYQADYWMPNLARTYQNAVAKGLQGVDVALYVEKYGERPKWTTTVESNIKKYYNQFGTSDLNFTTGGLIDEISTDIPIYSDYKKITNFIDLLPETILKGSVYMWIGILLVASVVMVLYPEVVKLPFKKIDTAINLINKIPSKGGVTNG